MKPIHYILLAAAGFIAYRLHKAGATLKNPIPSGLLNSPGSFLGLTPGPLAGTNISTEPAVYQPGNTDIKPEPGSTTEKPPSSSGPVTKAFSTAANTGSPFLSI